MRTLRSPTRLMPLALLSILGSVGSFSPALAAEPTCDAAYASPSTLWPPNHKYAAISIEGVADPDRRAAPKIVVQCIRQDEPLNTNGDGNTSIDAKGVGRSRASVRKERQGGGNGRVYHIDFLATDRDGERCEGSVTVGVPHNRKSRAVDEGPLYESTPNNVRCGGAVRNSAPVALPQSLEIENGPAAVAEIVLSGTDSDGDELTFAMASGPRHGELEGTPPTLTYRPEPGFVGEDAFGFTANDGRATSSEALVTIAVSRKNRAPVAESQTLSTDRDTPLDLVLQGSDADGDTLGFEVLESPGSGTLSGVAPIVRYAPDAGFTGTDTFAYRVGDGQAFSEAATVTIEVGAVNRAPTLAGLALETEGGVAVEVELAGVDPDGDALVYRLVGAPGAGTASVSGETLRYVPDATFAGTDTLRVVANDGALDSAAADVHVTVRPANRAPVADAGADATGAVGAPAPLSGGGTDPDGDALTYAWTLVSAPEGSASALENPTSATPALVPDLAGDYVLDLTVSDGRLDSAPDTVVIGVPPADGNRPPVAVITVSVGEEGGDFEGETVLDAYASSDPDGDELAYRWRIVSSGLPVDELGLLDFFEDDGGLALFYGPEDAEFDIVVELVANDGTLDSEPVRRSVTYSTLHPRAVITLEQDGTDVSFDGLASTPAGARLWYDWTVAWEGEPPSDDLVDDSASPTPRFLGTEPGRYEVTLMVEGYHGDPDFATETFVLRDAGAPNARPRLAFPPFTPEDAGFSFPTDDWRHYAYSPRMLRVENDDGPQDLVYEARYVVSPSGAALRPSFGPELDFSFGDVEEKYIDLDMGLTGQHWIALDDPERAPSGDYELHVTAFDGELTSEPLVYRFTLDRSPRLVSEPYTEFFRPETFERRVGESFDIDITGSVDPEGEPLVAEWTIDRAPAGSTAVLTGAGDRRSLIPDTEGKYQIGVRVTDPYGNLARLSWNVQASGRLYPSTLIEAGEDRTVVAGREVRLDSAGSRSRSSDTSLDFAWALRERPAESALGEALGTGPVAAFTPDRPGTYVVELEAVDGYDGARASDTVTIVAEANGRPVAAIEGSDTPVEIGTTVTLNGAGSTDPNGDPLTYAWRLVTAPSGSTLSLDDADVESVTFVPSTPGAYEFELVVDDGDDASEPETFALRAEDTSGGEPPIAVIAQTPASLGTGVEVRLDGGASSDPEGGALEYEWRLTRLPDGSTTTINAPASAVTAFVPDLPGAYTVELLVRDEGGNVDTATRELDVVTDRPDNEAPLAYAGYDRVLVERTELALLGGLSVDPDGDDLTYEWRLAERPSASATVIANADRPLARTTVDAPGRYVFALMVSDGLLTSEDSVTVDVVADTVGLPADPGFFGMQGLYGVDANADDVRDDVERMIHALYGEDPDVVAALRQLARSMYLVFGYLGRDDLVGTSLRELNAAQECLWAVTDDDPARASAIVMAEIVNTPERSDAYDDFEEAIDGVIFVGNPIENWTDSCEETER